MKKIIIAALIIMAFCITGCAAKNDTSDKNKNTNEKSVTEVEKKDKNKTTSKTQQVNTRTITIEDGKKIIRLRDKGGLRIHSLHYTNDFNAKQFGIPEETYMYYTYDDDTPEGPLYMVGTKSMNLYIGPSNGDLYFDLMKDGKAVKRYEQIKK